MYLGHLAAGLALKARVREAPLSWLLAATVVSDLLCGALFITGAEQVVVHGECTKFANAHATMPYSHSLTGTLVLAAIAVMLGLRASRRVGFALGLAVLSHYVLDVLSHHPDMPLLGFGATPDHLLGTELAAFPVAHYLIELAWCVTAWALLDRTNRKLLWTILVLMALYANTLFAFWCVPVQSAAATGVSMLVMFSVTPLVLLWASRSDRYR